jgi:crotonobetainyl-CoA:carnitine CoA-transferase CaiB-like acyl-CoA transferase
MSILAFNDRDWKSLCTVMDMPMLAQDPRFADPAARLANDRALYAIVRPAIAARPCADWARRLTDARIMHERLNSYAEFLDQPQVRETGLIQWLSQAGVPQPVPVPALPGTPSAPDGTPRAEAPVPGQHTRAILAEHGFTPPEIAALLADGTVAAAARKDI